MARAPQFRESILNLAFSFINDLYPISAPALRVKLKAEFEGITRTDLTEEIAMLVRELIYDTERVNCFSVTGKTGTPMVIFMPKDKFIITNIGE